MTEPKTIYIVTKGSYSDYRIDAVFTDKAEAERHRDLIDPSDTDSAVEEWSLDTPIKCPVGLLPYRVYMDKEGHADVKRAAIDDNCIGDAWSWSILDTRPHTYCLAKSELHAVKIANERRAIAIAENRWPEPPPSRPSIVVADTGALRKSIGLETP